jgi:mannose-6-phosphate isomerase-like protein (cupin superfamily)
LANRFLITGVDEQGRSCVVREEAPAVSPFVSGITVGLVASSGSAPPPVRPPGRGELLGVASAPGVASWSIIEFPAEVTTPVHHTDSMDFDIVLDGRVFLVLDDGSHQLEAGDGTVLSGVDHHWRTEAESCRMSVVVIATAQREDSSAPG